MIEINGHEDVRWHYFLLSKILGLEHHLVMGRTVDGANIVLSETNISQIMEVIDQRD